MSAALPITVRGNYTPEQKLEALIQAIRNRHGSRHLVVCVVDAEDILFASDPSGERAS